jgi:hypothetical protein
MRGELKMHGRTIVLREYKIIPQNTDELSDKEKRKAIRENVAPLLDRGSWAHAPAVKVFMNIILSKSLTTSYECREKKSKYLLTQLSNLSYLNFFSLVAILMHFIILMHLVLRSLFLP